LSSLFSFNSHLHNPDLHSFPTRRSSDLRLIAIGPKTNVSPTTVHIQLCKRIVSPLLRFRGNKHSDVSVNQSAPTPTHPPCSPPLDRKSTRLNSSHDQISYAVFCLKKKKN